MRRNCLLLLICLSLVGCDRTTALRRDPLDAQRVATPNDALAGSTTAEENHTIAVQREIPYSRTREPHQTLNLFLPEGDGPFPVTVCFLVGPLSWVTRKACPALVSISQFTESLSRLRLLPHRCRVGPSSLAPQHQ